MFEINKTSDWSNIELVNSIKVTTSNIKYFTCQFPGSSANMQMHIAHAHTRGLP